MMSRPFFFLLMLRDLIFFFGVKCVAADTLMPNGHASSSTPLE